MEAVLLFLGNLILQYQDVIPLWAIAALAFVGSLHLVLPPVQAAVKAIVLATPSKEDDRIYEEVTTSKYYEVFCVVVKWLSGLDLKKKKK